MGYVRLVGERPFNFQMPCWFFLHRFYFCIVFFLFYYGGVENKSLPNYVEKLSLLENAKDHQIST
jgi:hypothetical protein